MDAELIQYWESRWRDIIATNVWPRFKGSFPNISIQTIPPDELTYYKTNMVLADNILKRIEELICST